jgi:hypothetical protein
MKRKIKIFYILATFFTIINISLCAWYVINGDIYFFTDVARDFFLFQEIEAKKIMLIGPRSSNAGLFHGPLWAYLNYPAFIIGKGNPLMLGWYWIALIALFLVGCFYIAKNLFNKDVAFLYILLISQLLIFHARGLFNPHGALFLMPFLFFTFIKYTQCKRSIYLLLCLFISGLVIQFQMAIGVPFLFLSTLWILYIIIKDKKFKHIFSYLILFIPLSTFVIFDLRNEFLQLKSALSFVSPGSSQEIFNYFSLLEDRLRLLIHGLQLTSYYDFYSSSLLSLLLFALTVILLWKKINQGEHKSVYFPFIYFYIGFIILSFLNKGSLFYHQFFPIFSLTSLIFVSLFTSKYKKIFIAFFIILYIYNTIIVLKFVNDSRDFIGKSFESWRFLSIVAEEVFDSPDQTFGYFVYAPDIVGYGPKYAMRYYAENSSKDAYYFQKKRVTYLTVEQPPSSQPDIKDEWWRINKLRIEKDPVKIKTFPNGYKVERYVLSIKEEAIPPASDIDPGLHFR